MTPILVQDPAVEPVSVAEMRTYLRLDDGAEDTLLAALIQAARLAVEAAARRILVDSRWRIVLDRWPPDRVVRLPLSPVVAVERVGILDAAGVAADLALTAYRLEAGEPPRLAVDAAAPSPGRLSGIAIEFRAGFGATAEAVPAPLRQAVRMLAARWFEHRGDEEAAAFPADVAALLAPFRPARL